MIMDMCVADQCHVYVGTYVGAVEEMMCVVHVNVTNGA